MGGSSELMIMIHDDLGKLDDLCKLLTKYGVSHYKFDGEGLTLALSRVQTERRVEPIPYLPEADKKTEEEEEEDTLFYSAD